MAKKQVPVSLRKPPTPEATSLSKPIADVATLAGERRELTVLLPIDVARQLAVRCLELDRDASAFVAEAVANALSSAPPAARDVVTVTISGNAWARVRSRITELTTWLPWTPFGRAQHV